MKLKGATIGMLSHKASRDRSLSGCPFPFCPRSWLWSKSHLEYDHSSYKTRNSWKDRKPQTPTNRQWRCSHQSLALATVISQARSPFSKDKLNKSKKHKMIYPMLPHWKGTEVPWSPKSIFQGPEMQVWIEGQDVLSWAVLVRCGLSYHHALGSSLSLGSSQN